MADETRSGDHRGGVMRMRDGRRTANELGVRLRALRAREGVSLGTLSHMLGVARSTLEAIETGRCGDTASLQRVRRWMDGSRVGRQDAGSPRLIPRRDRAR